MPDALKELPEASFAGVRFPVESADTEGGQDVVEHVAYRRRGADLEPTGQRPYKGTLTVPLINTEALVKRYGQLFPGLRYDLLRAFEDTPLGELVHPTYGVFTACIASWRETVAPDRRDGVIFTVTWTEHYGQASRLLGPDGTTPTNPASATQQRADAADAAMSHADASGTYTPVADTVSSQLAYLESATRTPTEVQSAVRQMLAPVTANLALPAFAGADAHPAVVALIELRASVYRLRALYDPTRDGTRLYTVPQTAPLWQVSQDVYGDCSQVALLLSANVVSRPNAVPAGTVLTVPPRPS